MSCGVQIRVRRAKAVRNGLRAQTTGRTAKRSGRGSRSLGRLRLLGRHGVGLPRDAEHALPRLPVRVHLTRRLFDHGVDGDVDQTVVTHADREGGIARHRAVHHILREELAIDRVTGVGGHGAYHVRGVDVLDRRHLPARLHVRHDLVLEPQT